MDPAPEMTLKELRASRGLTQVQVAKRMRINQSGVAKIEDQTTDIRISTLRRYVAALGGELTIHAIKDGFRIRVA